MRFCPFCTAENVVEATHCSACARRLPPVPQRRQRTPTNPQAIVGTAPVRIGPEPSGGKQSLLRALTPGPAAARRQAPSAMPAPSGVEHKRRTDFSETELTAVDDAWTVGPPPTPTSVSAPPAPAPQVPAPRVPVPWPPAPQASAPQSPPRRAGSNSRPPPLPTRARSASSPPPFDDGFTPLPAPVQREYDAFQPPPTRIVRGEGLGDRPFTPPSVLPIPEIPEPGLVLAAKYSIAFLRARWQRRGAIRSLAEDIKRDTDAVDQILGSLGRTARSVGLDGRAFSTENAAISAAESRSAQLEQDGVELQSRKSDENTRYVDVERDRMAKVTEAEAALAEVQRELTHLEGQRRTLRDKRKDIERRQRAYLSTAEQRDQQAAGAAVGDDRARMRSTAEGHRREAAALEPERQDIDRRLASLEKPIADSSAAVDVAKGELEAARRSLDDAREGHRHRLAELDAEHKSKTKDTAQAEAEIARRLVMLGTLLNLNRVERPEFTELYLRIDRLRTAIGARTTEIERLTAERDAYDKASLWRGLGTLIGVVVLLISLIVLFRACT